MVSFIPFIFTILDDSSYFLKNTVLVIALTPVFCGLGYCILGFIITPYLSSVKRLISYVVYLWIQNTNDDTTYSQLWRKLSSKEDCEVENGKKALANLLTFAHVDNATIVEEDMNHTTLLTQIQPSFFRQFWLDVNGIGTGHILGLTKVRDKSS